MYSCHYGSLVFQNITGGLLKQKLIFRGENWKVPSWRIALKCISKMEIWQFIVREDFWLVTMKWLKLRLLPGILLCKTLPHWAPLSSSDLPFAAWRLDSSSNSAWCLFLTSPLKTDGWEREPLLTIAIVSCESNRWLLTQRSQTQRFWAPVFLPVVQALFCFHPSTLYLLE